MQDISSTLFDAFRRPSSHFPQLLSKCAIAGGLWPSNISDVVIIHFPNEVCECHDIQRSILRFHQQLEFRHGLTAHEQAMFQP